MGSETAFFVQRMSRGVLRPPAFVFFVLFNFFFVCTFRFWEVNLRFRYGSCAEVKFAISARDMYL